MKKFTENDTKQPHYSGNEILRNKLYEMVETLHPTIEGVDESKITMTGKEDLVEELIKVVENSSIDASIDLFREFKSKMREVKVEEKHDPLMEAFNQVKTNTEEELIKENAKTEIERAKTHYSVTDSDWDALTKEEKADMISKLPERKGKNKDKE